MSGAAELVLGDRQVLADLATFVGRAKAADPEGAIRLQAQGLTLAASVGVLPGSGLLGEGAVVGLRAIPLAAAAELDATVSLTSVSDRLARLAQATPPAVPEATTLAVPPVRVSVAWAALAPPRSGWERVGAVPAEALAEEARLGIADVASGTPARAGAQAVTALRRQVWGRATDTTPPVPAGGAFAAYVLGFARPGTELTVWAHGRWTRLSSASGHVLIR